MRARAIGMEEPAPPHQCRRGVRGAPQWADISGAGVGEGGGSSAGERGEGGAVVVHGDAMDGGEF